MSKVAVVTDSTSALPKELCLKYNISVAPQVLIWNGDTYEDGVDIQPSEFYKRLKDAKVMPTTSQVTPGSFHKVFVNLLDQGYDVLAVLISEKLSGTIASAIQARDLLPKANIEIVDSCSTGMGLGFPALQAARAAQQGATLSECKRLAEEIAPHVGLFLTVDTLEFLHRGGRIGGAARFLGSALNIKPILELRDGRLEPMERVRTRSKAVSRLLELAEIATSGKKSIRIASMHGNAEAEACQLLDRAVQSMKPEEAILTDLSPVIGTHAGPGVLGLAFMTAA